MRIEDAKSLSNKILLSFGFSQEDADLITRNLIEAEMAGRKTHGLIRLPALKKQIQNQKVNVKGKKPTVISETPTSLHIDSKSKPGFIVIYQSLEKAIKKAKESGTVSVGLKNLGYASGYIGDYARVATENNLIFIGFNNSPGGLIPYGSKKELWGTNPITIGIPTNEVPVILDMASSKITWGDLLVAKQENQKLPNDVALNEEGNPTTDPEKAMQGGLLPIGEHKGSGLAFIVELLAGALTGLRVGYSVPGGWGTFYILIDPTRFRPLEDFKKDVETAINELKNVPKAEGFKEIYFAGEQSGSLRKQHLQQGEIEVSEELFKELNTL